MLKAFVFGALLQIPAYIVPSIAGDYVQPQNTFCGQLYSQIGAKSAEIEKWKWYLYIVRNGSNDPYEINRVNMIIARLESELKALQTKYYGFCVLPGAY